MIIWREEDGRWVCRKVFNHRGVNVTLGYDLNEVKIQVNGRMCAAVFDGEFWVPDDARITYDVFLGKLRVVIRV